MIDARKWVAAKQAPKKYGLRQEVEARPTLEQLVLASMKLEDERRPLGDRREER